MKILDILEEAPQGKIAGIVKTKGQQIQQRIANDHSAKLANINVKTPEQAVEHIFNNLHTIANENLRAKYLDWVVNQYINPTNNIKLEDIEGNVSNIVGRYNQLKRNNQLEPNENNLTQLQFRTMRQIVDKKQQSGQSGVKKSQALANVVMKIKQLNEEEKQVAVRYWEKGQVLVAIPLTKEASTKLGSTAWCTAGRSADNYYNSYAADGHLYIMFTADGEKYQYHGPKKEWCDKHNEMMEHEEIMALYKKWPELWPAMKDIIIQGIKGIHHDDSRHRPKNET